MKYVVVVLACLSFSTVSAHSQEPDPIKEKLDKAKAAYDAEVAKVRQGVLDALQKREDAARNSGDKKAVDLVKAERQALEEKGELPKSVTTAAHHRDLQQARAALEAAYKQAIKSYLQGRMDAEADFVSKELKELQEKTTAAPPPPMLVKGAVWEGKKANLPKGELLPFVLKVTDVSGPRFAGEITIDKQYTFAVAGQVTGGQVVFRTEKKGLAQQIFEGRMSKERMELLFLAISAKGEKKKGTVSLALKAK
jgi:hypothetical protein